MSGWADLAGLLVIRPLSLELDESELRRAPFSAAWSDTVQLLAREVHHLHPREAILEAGFTDGQLRQDGMPRATAKLDSQAVVLTLVGTAHGDLRYPCATFTSWQDNVRAIALSLESLRRVDRYGVTRRGEQYTGWKQLEATSATPQAAREVLREVVPSASELWGDRTLYKAALRAAHPDHGGSQEALARVLVAGGHLGVA